MKTVSILNHVLGPVMRGPSSSHTAGAFHIGCMARSILGGTPRQATLAFDPHGSYAATFRPQGADRGFAMGLMNRPLTDESFFTALRDAPAAGMDLLYEIRPLAAADHPNTVELDLTATDGRRLNLVARSIGGGEVEITRVDGRPVLFNGSAFEVLVLGGYTNFIPLDETIDAVYAVGRAIPAELRCTSKGGLAIAPSARALKPGVCNVACSACP